VSFDEDGGPTVTNQTIDPRMNLEQSLRGKKLGRAGIPVPTPKK
jgi:hypothetical protein